MKKFNRERLEAFMLRRKSNMLGLLVLTVCSALITLLCALSGFKRTGILVFVTVLMAALCVIQMYKMRSSFRTIRDFRGMRRKSRAQGE